MLLVHLLFMKFGEQISLGFSTYGDAQRFIFKHGLWWYLLVPGILNILLIVGVFFLSSVFGDQLATWLVDWFSPDAEWLKWLLGFFIALIVKLLLFFLYILMYKYLILIIMSPFLALLSEKVEEILTGKSYPFVFRQFMKDVMRGVLIALRNMFIEFGLILLFYILAFIPLVNLFGMLFLFIMQSYFYGFSMLDYSNERQKQKIGPSIAFVRRYKWLAIANGTVFYLLFLIPFVGWLVSPAYAVVAATLAHHKIRTTAV